MPVLRDYLILSGLVASLGFSTAPPPSLAKDVILAAAAEENSKSEPDAEQLTPEQKMQKRFPQPVRVGDLVGLPLLDEDDSTIGYVREVVRSPKGKVFLIVPYSAWFGWLRSEWGKRPVAVPIEVVAILARQLDSLDMSREDFDDAPTWIPIHGKPIPPDEKTLVALGRR